MPSEPTGRRICDVCGSEAERCRCGRGFAPSETPEPTQEQLAFANKWFADHPGGWLVTAARLVEAVAAPLREEIERLTKERDEARALKITEVMGATKRVCDERDAAEAKALSLEKQLSEERLKGEACTLDWAEKLDAALAAASRAREEQGALRAATLEEAAQHFAQPELDDTNVKCRHVAHFLRRLAAGEKMTFDPSAAALAPPAQTQQGLSDGARADQLECALREIMACVNEDSTRGLDAAMRMAEEALDLKPRLDKQSSPSAAPAQEPERRARIRKAVLGTADCSDAAFRLTFDCSAEKHSGAVACADCIAEALFLLDEAHAQEAARESAPPSIAQPASPEGALREALKVAIDQQRYQAEASPAVYEGSTLIEPGVDAFDMCSACGDGDWPCVNPTCWVTKGLAALAGQPAREDDLPPICMEPVSFDVKGDPVDGSFSGTKPCAEPLVCPRHSAREDDQKALRAAALEEAARQLVEGDAALELRHDGGAPPVYFEVCVLCDEGNDRVGQNIKHNPQKACGKLAAALAGSPAGEGREDNQNQPTGKGAGK